MTKAKWMTGVLLTSGILAFAGAQGIAFGGKKTSTETVWVSKSDGGMSCEKESGQTLEAVTAQFKIAGIHVLEAEKGTDGLMRVQMCGAPSGSQNRLKISRSDLTQAEGMGFNPDPQKK